MLKFFYCWSVYMSNSQSPFLVLVEKDWNRSPCDEMNSGSIQILDIMDMSVSSVSKKTWTRILDVTLKVPDSLLRASNLLNSV